MYFVCYRGLVPHCIAILKTCHNLTEKMVGMTMGNTQQLRTPETLMDIVTIAKRISPRVDDVVKSMYPPLDPRLLEARYVLPVVHLKFSITQCIFWSGGRGIFLLLHKMTYWFIINIRPFCNWKY